MSISYAGVKSVGATRKITDITFDSSYIAGGESISPAKFGIRNSTAAIIGMTCIGGNPAAAAFNFIFDTTNKTLRAYRRNGTNNGLIVEESVTVASSVGTLAKVPAYILAIHATTATSAGSKRIIPVGTTTAAGQVAVNFATGGLTFYATDAVTVAKVTYIPLGVGPFVEANRVVDEAVTLATGGVDLANRAALIQYVYNTTGSSLPTLIPVGESPSTGQIAIDINNAGATTITPNSAQNTNAAKVTYWKYTPFVPFGWTDQADIAVTSNAIALAEVLDISDIWIPGFGQVIVGETSGGTTNLQSTMLGPSGAAATNVSVFDPAKNTITFVSGDAYVTIEMPYILLDAAMGSGLAEVATGEDLSGVTARFEVLLKGGLGGSVV